MRLIEVRDPPGPDGCDGLLALLVTESAGTPGTTGTTFLTPPGLPLQAARVCRRRGERIEPHTHYALPRSVLGTPEVLVVMRGRVQVDVYNHSQEHVWRGEARKGDVVVLLAGGHGFLALEDLEMVEVKQGPYHLGADKLPIPGAR